LVVVQRRAGMRPQIERCVSFDEQRGGDPEQFLRQSITKHGLARAAIFAVTGTDDYQLVQVEAPEVQPSELRAAIRWRLRDVINFHIDDAVIDVFEIPDQSRRAQGKMLFAVAARSAAVQRLVGSLAPVARGFDVIDIPELCLRNVSALFPQDQKGVATLLIGDRFAQLILTRQGVLYLARRIEFGRGLELDFDARQGESQSPPIDAASLALELQRSLDYFESHYDQAPISELLLAPGNERCRDLAAQLRAETSLRVEVMKLGDVIDDTDRLGEELQPEVLLALGAALRVETTAL
jgi:MSHA biogenesis protein MshI